MFQIGKTLISEDIIEKEFVCNLNACKGVCCVEGHAGAPLEKSELEKLREVYPKVKPFLRPKGIEAIETQGVFVVSDDGDLETPLVDGAECAYVTFDEKNTALCGIEEAYNKGLIDFKKPISCHLYPVRTQNFSEFTAVNYHKWYVCTDACSLGEELGVPIYKFVKEALIRKFGQNWYAELEKTAQKINSKK